MVLVELSQLFNVGRVRERGEDEARCRISNHGGGAMEASGGLVISLFLSRPGTE